MEVRNPNIDARHFDRPELIQCPLHLDATTFRVLLEQQGPSLGLWRAAEVAALREVAYEYPVLDLGCGDGLVTSLVVPQVEIGVDPNSGALDQATSRGIYERFESAFIEKVRIADGSIGTVLSNSVLEHIPNLDAVLATIARILRPGGRLVFTVPTEAFSKELILPLKRYATWRNRQLNHLNLWPVECWIQHLERVGLHVEEVRPYLRPAWVRTWDILELFQQLWIGHRRVFSIFWRRLTPTMLDRLAGRASRINLAASMPGGGRLIIARKPIIE